MAGPDEQTDKQMDKQQELDCRGQHCPQPVIQTKEALEAMGRGRLQVLVDNEAARSNVARFAHSRGLAVEIGEEEGGIFRLSIDLPASGPPDAGPAAETEPAEFQCSPPGHGVIGIIAADTMGRGDEQLGRILLRAFIKTLPALDQPPAALYFYNSGVRLTAGPPDEGLLEPLRELARRGVAIYSCGTCLDFFGLQDQLLIGEVTNMYVIIKAMAEAPGTIRP